MKLAAAAKTGDDVRRVRNLFYLRFIEARLDLALSVAQRLVTKIQGLVDMDWSLDREEIATRLKFLGEI